MEETNAIELANVTVAYESKPVLVDISVGFKRGKLTAVIGPNGAGKSTLIKSVLGLLKPEFGEISFTVGEKVKGKYKNIKKKVAYVPQNNSVDWDFPVTVLDVVVMGRYGHLGWFKRPKKKDYDSAKAALDQMGLSSFLNRQISQLSGGQRQRVFLARALTQEAEIYIMDEPLAGVDIKTERVIMQLLKELINEGKTIIVVHHDLQTVKEYFDDVVFINQEVIAYGSVDKAFTEKNIQSTYNKNRNLGESGNR